MKAIKILLAGSVGIAAVAAASPASAQYYPGYGNGDVLGQVLGQILNPGYGYGGGRYGMDSRVAVDRCAAAVTERVNREYGYAYGNSGAYGYPGSYYGRNAGPARVVAITSVEQRSSSKLRVRGIAQTTGINSGYGYNNVPVELSFKCNIDYRGYISDIDLDRRAPSYGYAPAAPYAPQQPYQPYGNYPRY